MLKRNCKISTFVVEFVDLDLFSKKYGGSLEMLQGQDNNSNKINRLAEEKRKIRKHC